MCQTESFLQFCDNFPFWWNYLYMSAAWWTGRRLNPEERYPKGEFLMLLLAWLTPRSDRKLLLILNLSDSTQNTEWANQEVLGPIYTRTGSGLAQGIESLFAPAEVRRSFSSLDRVFFWLFFLLPLSLAIGMGLCFFCSCRFVRLHCQFALLLAARWMIMTMMKLRRVSAAYRRGAAPKIRNLPLD